jgi:TolB protein
MIGFVRIASLLAVAGLAAATASAASVPGGEIVFSSSSGVNGKGQVWVMKPNGAGRHAVTPAGIDVGTAAPSRDGRRIAYVRRGEIYVIASNGSHVRRLTFSPSTEAAPAWSPDGRWIAYSSYSSAHTSIWKMRPDGRRKTRLAGPGMFAAPAWSPDGRRIAYAAAGGQIWVMNANGTGRHPLTRTAFGTGVDWAPSWSPDGRRVAYESNVKTSWRNPTNEIWVINADGSRPVRLTQDHVDDTRPAWSPDGHWILFASERPNGGRTHLWLMRPNGEGLHRVTSWGGEQSSPSWAR